MIVGGKQYGSGYQMARFILRIRPKPNAVRLSVIASADLHIRVTLETGSLAPNPVYSAARRTVWPRYGEPLLWRRAPSIGIFKLLQVAVGPQSSHAVLLAACYDCSKLSHLVPIVTAVFPMAVAWWTFAAVHLLRDDYFIVLSYPLYYALFGIWQCFISLIAVLSFIFRVSEAEDDGPTGKELLSAVSSPTRTQPGDTTFSAATAYSGSNEHALDALEIDIPTQQADENDIVEAYASKYKERTIT